MTAFNFKNFARTALLCATVAAFSGCQIFPRSWRETFSHGSMEAVALQCEYLPNPLGIDETSPRLSWRLETSERAQSQTAYRILVASDENKLDDKTADLWDSGKVSSDDTSSIVYGGKQLTTGQRCFWKVQVWDKHGEESGWCKPALWTMGLLNQTDWRGTWIGYDKTRQVELPDAPFEGAKWIWFGADKGPDFPKAQRYFMSTLHIPAGVTVQNAEMFVAGDDKYWLNFNGYEMAHPEAGDDVHRARYINLTSQIKTGDNTIRADVENPANGPAGFLAKIIVKTTDGQTITLVTDESWRSSKDGGANWHNRAIGATEWPAAQVVANYGAGPWGKLKYSTLLLPPPPYLRTSFNVSKSVTHATLYATALGTVDLHINGQRISDDRFTPGWTDYAKRVHYRTYDVTKSITSGKNVFGAILADGWYSGYIGWGQIRNHYGKKPRFKGQLQIEYNDGTGVIIATGPDWKAGTGPIRETDFLMGEMYDARLVQKWDTADFNDSGWDKVDTGSEMNPVIEAHTGPPVRVFTQVKPQVMTQPKPGSYVMNMVQNFAGVVRLKISGEPGQKITLRFAERLNTDGTVYTTNLRGARATDTYICRGGGEETWEPRFTFHGFQYVEITGLKKAPNKDTITGLALSSDTPVTGEFSCSDGMLNRLHQNIYWTQRANFIDIPTDCPQRDERLGWMGDAQVYIRAATLNADVHAFFTKWLVDVDDGQRKDGQFPMVAPVKIAGDDGGPAWADAGVICPWTIYDVYGDKRILAKHYSAMTRFIDFCKNRSTADLLPPKQFHCFGDWLNIKDNTTNTVIYTAYFAYSTKLVARAAEVLGKTDDAAKYNQLFNRIKAAFNKAYITADGRIGNDTQTSYVLALAFDLVDGEKETQAANRLVENIEKRGWHLSTGFIGTKSLMLALAKIGRNDVASRLIHRDDFPSWGFSIKQGATSIWERWDGWTPEKGFQDAGMNSFAHYSFGAVYQWMVENLGGIRSDGPAYKHITIAPYHDGHLTFADTTYESIHGRIESHWKFDDGKFTMKVTVPPNTTATIYVPAKQQDSVTADGKAAGKSNDIKFVRMEKEAAVFEVGSGSYNFESR